MWATALLMAFDPQDNVSQMYCATLACLTCVGSINVLAPLPRAFYALLLPVASTLAVLFAAAETLSGVFEAAMVLIAAFMATGLMQHHARLLRDSLALRHEREATLVELEQAMQARSRFLAAASHDLRQPLHALGLLAAEARAELSGRRAERTAERIQEMVQALDALVDALMDISRIDSSAITVHIRPVALAPLLERLVFEFTDEAESRGLQLRLWPSEVWVLSDGLHLERILRNLLSNALRYTTHGGVLLAARVRGQGDAARVVLSLWDTGAGIAPRDQARVFEEFVQLDNPGRRRTLGMGLGLAIVQRLAQRLGHTIELRSRVGRGSCFSVAMLVASAAGQDEEAEYAGAPGLGSPSLAGLEVWLVEDDPDVLAVTGRLLERWGCAVRTSLDGSDLDAAPAPHCLVCDWRLPAGRNGLEVIRALRAATQRDIRALLISGETVPAAMLAEAQAQHIDVARKPLAPARLRAWLASEGLPSASAVLP
jgi:signal transduction histidine kinase/CheY-like chemotaxis protein